MHSARNVRRIIGSLTKAVVVVIAAWGSVAEATPASRAQREPDSITLGMIAPLSGPISAIGREVVDGALLAVEDFKVRHPLQKVTIVTEDDSFEASRGMTAFKKLIDVNRIEGLLNLSSPTIGAIGPRVRQLQLPVVQLGEQPDEPRDDTIFQMTPGSIQGFEEFGRRTRTRTAGKAILFVAESSTIERFSKAFTRGFGEDVVVVPVSAQSNDFRSMLVASRIKDVAWIIPFLMPEQAVVVVNELLSRRERPQLALPLFQVGFEDYKRLVKNLDGLRDDFTVAYVDPSPEFRERFEKAYGYSGGSWSGFGYDGMCMLLETSSSDASEWTKKMRDYESIGVSGGVEFDSVGVRTTVLETLTVGEYMERHESRKDR